MALVGFDNAIEVCVDTFVALHPRRRGNYRIRREDVGAILHHYHTKMEFLERYAAEQGVALDGVSIDEVVWYQQLRNELTCLAAITGRASPTRRPKRPSP